jgi:hypothetical protein
MTILPAGTFKISDYRKPIPDRVKLQVMLDLFHEWFGCGGAFELSPDAADYQFDHDPALVNRDYDTKAGDFIPPQNDSDHIKAILRGNHDKKTFGREPGAEKTVTTRGSDVGEAARTKDIRASEALHQAALASKAGDYTKAAELLAAGRERKKRPKRQIPSRPFARVKRPLQRQKSKQFP